MRTYIVSIPIVLVLWISEKSFAQCPVDEDTFRAGGTYSGNCVLEVGGSVAITGTVNWTSGVLTLTGGPGNIQVNSGGVLNILGGEIATIDDGDDADIVPDGQITINNGGTINLSPGAELTWALNLTVNGTFNLGGRAESLLGRFSIGSGAVLHIPYGGALTTPGTGDSDIQGSLTVEGSLSTGGDIEINGGSATVTDNASLVVGADLFVYGGGSFQIDALGVVAVSGRVANADDSPTFPTISGSGSIEVGGSLQVGTHLSIYDTTPNSELLGGPSGEITVSGSFSDAECATYAELDYTFCACTGGGGTCSAVLPVELVTFTAQQQGKNVLLQWTTASELNNAFFTIERINDSDEIITLSNISGNGTSNVLNEYQFTDTTPLPGNNYYRLKQTDFSGFFVYSAVIKLKFECIQQELIVFINPTEQKFTSIQASGLPPNKNVPISMTAINGSLCFSEYSATNEAGVLLKEIDMTNIPSGLYIINVAGLHVKYIKQ